MFRPMRRIKQQLSDDEALKVLKNAKRGVLSVIGDDGWPYGIYINPYWKDGKLYFNPHSNLTRAQAATMIGRTQEKGYALSELAFTDVKLIPAYAAYYIQTMMAQGIISGYADGTFRPHNNITRGQMAKILYNLM